MSKLNKNQNQLMVKAKRKSYILVPHLTTFVLIPSAISSSLFSPICNATCPLDIRFFE